MTSSSLSFDPGEWKTSRLWEAWEEGENALWQELTLQNDEYGSDDRYTMDELDVIAEEADAYFRKQDAEMLDEAERRIEREMDEARYGFFLD